jgi:sugar lactone lactonase YvrE
MSDRKMTASVKGMTIDTSGFLYSATSMGVQVSDQLGRVNFIFSNPANKMRDVKIGGADYNVLYVACNGKIFFRKINSRGILSWQKPIRPTAPRL